MTNLLKNLLKQLRKSRLEILWTFQLTKDLKLMKLNSRRFSATFKQDSNKELNYSQEEKDMEIKDISLSQLFLQMSKKI